MSKGSGCWCTAATARIAASQVSTCPTARVPIRPARRGDRGRLGAGGASSAAPAGSGPGRVAAASGLGGADVAAARRAAARPRVRPCPRTNSPVLARAARVAAGGAGWAGTPGRPGWPGAVPPRPGPAGMGAGCGVNEAVVRTPSCGRPATPAGADIAAPPPATGLGGGAAAPAPAPGGRGPRLGAEAGSGASVLGSGTSAGGSQCRTWPLGRHLLLGAIDDRRASLVDEEQLGVADHLRRHRRLLVLAFAVPTGSYRRPGARARPAGPWRSTRTRGPGSGRAHALEPTTVQPRTQRGAGGG